MAICNFYARVTELSLNNTMHKATICVLRTCAPKGQLHLKFDI